MTTGASKKLTEERGMTTKTNPAVYEARGSVRGACGHLHRSIGAAVRCARRDHACCRRIGGGAYSDRVVVRIGAELTDAERDAIVVAYAEQES